MKAKRIVILATVLLTSTAFYMGDHVLTRLGIKEDIARQHILGNLVGNHSADPIDVSVVEDHGGAVEQSAVHEYKGFRIPRAYLLANILQDDKSAIARELCTYVKEYVNSTDFLAEYEKNRAAVKPVSEPWRSNKEQIEDMKSSLEKSENDIEKAKKSGILNAPQIAQMNAALDQQRKQIDQFSDPTPNKTLWEKQYPADPAVILKQRMQEYLDLVATVDFNAALTGPDKYNVKKFTNPEYEKKGPKWKAVYRAGPEVNGAVTLFVKEWLKGPIIDKDNLQPMSSVAKNQLSIDPDSSNSENRSEKATEKKSLLNKGSKKLKDKLKGKIGL